MKEWQMGRRHLWKSPNVESGKRKLDKMTRVEKKGAELQKGPNIAKRPTSEVMGMKWESPETKRKKINGPMEIMLFASLKAKHKLDMERREKQTDGTWEMIVEFLEAQTAEVGYQPHRQP